MIRCLLTLSVVALTLAGCSTPATEVRFVPNSTVFRVEPQPTTYGEYQKAERQGFLVAATGHGEAIGIDDLPTQIQAGERLHVLRVDLASGELLVLRLDYNAIARVNYEEVEVRGTTYPR